MRAPSFLHLALFALVLVASGCASANDRLRVAAIRAAPYGGVFVGVERGYFAAEGLDLDLIYFEASPPIAVAVVAGDLDIGIAATSAAFFSLADKLRIVGGFAREAPGFQGMTFVASNRGWDAGLRSFKDLAGHTMSIGTVGSSPHYSLALVEAKYGIDPKSVQLMALQSFTNQVSALIGGRVDAGVTISTGLMPAVKRGDVKLLGFSGDETPWQLSSIFAPRKLLDEHRDRVERFLRAYRKGAHDYMDAFADPGGKRRDGPTAPAILAIMSKYIGQPPDAVHDAIGYVDPDARTDVKDLQRQVDWYKAQGMLKGDITAADALDQRLVVALP